MSPSDDAGAGTVACGGCGRTVEDTVNYCPHCGDEVRAMPSHCPDCGRSFDDRDEFCSRCGAARRTETRRQSARDDRPDAARSRRASAATGPDASATEGVLDRQNAVGREYTVDRHDAFRERVQVYVDEGWEVVVDEGDRVEVANRHFGSPAVHVVLLLLSAGLVNVLYALYSYTVGAEVRVLSVGDRSPTGQETPNDAVLYLWSVLFSLMGAGMLLSQTPAGIAIGVVLLTVGAVLAPVVHRRIGRRHSITTFGRARAVDHKVVRPGDRTDEPCVVCGTEFDVGLVRRRRSEIAVAGFPVYTSELEYNHYCADCAETHVFGTGLSPVATDTAGSDPVESVGETSGREGASDGDWGEAPAERLPERTTPEGDG